IRSGTVRLDASSGAFGNGLITMADNTMLSLSRPSATVGLLATSGTGAGSTVTNAQALVISGAGTQVFAGQITGGLNLMKAGSGTQYLNGANTYTGPTNINGGTLGGTGSISGAVYLNAGGSIAPGNSIGTFTLGSLDISSGVFAAGS